MLSIVRTLNCERSARIDSTAWPEAFKQPHLLRYLPQFNFIPKHFSLKRIFSDFSLDYSVFEKMFPELLSKYNSCIDSLSGGGHRLVELYTVAKSNDLFVMLDEPFTHLSPTQVDKVKELLSEEKANKGFLITDHMYRHVTDISDNLYILTNGQAYLSKNIKSIEELGYARL